MNTELEQIATILYMASTKDEHLKRYIIELFYYQFQLYEAERKLKVSDEK